MKSVEKYLRSQRTSRAPWRIKYLLSVTTRLSPILHRAVLIWRDFILDRNKKLSTPARPYRPQGEIRGTVICALTIPAGASDYTRAWSYPNKTRARAWRTEWETARKRESEGEGGTRGRLKRARGIVRKHGFGKCRRWAIGRERISGRYVRRGCNLPIAG